MKAHGLEAEALRAWPKGETDARQAESQGSMVKVLRIRGTLENLNQREMHRTPSKCSECPPLMQQRGLVHFMQSAKR